MRLPNERAGFAPEADLRTIMIRRPDHPTQTDHTETSLARSELAEGLFFTKGLATTEGFRPSYWSYCKAPDIGAREACAVVDVRTADVSRGDICLDAAATQQALTDEAQSSGTAIGCGPQDASPEDDEFSRRERAFLEVHRQALMQEPEPWPDCDGTIQSETPSLASGNSDFRAPLADLRTVQLRRSGRDSARVDELFVRKSHAASEDAPSRRMQGPDVTPAGARQTSVVTSATEIELEEPRELPSRCDPTSTVVGPTVSLEVAMPMGEPLRLAEERAGASEPPRVGLDDMRIAEEPERPNDAVRDAASKRASTERRSLLAPIQEAIIVFGCVALMASLRVFNPSDALPPPPIVAVEQPQVAAPEAHPPSAALVDLLARGDERLRSGDVVAARLFYEKASDAGNARGALMMGATYDPKFLASIGVYGLRGDEPAALAWYRRAGDLGDHEAAKLGNPGRK
jgi:hypothetical protein